MHTFLSCGNIITDMSRRVNRSTTTLKKKSTEREDSFVPGTPAERVSWVWELTAEAWSLEGSEYVERRLPRDVTHLVRK